MTAHAISVRRTRMSASAAPGTPARRPSTLVGRLAAVTAAGAAIAMAAAGLAGIALPTPARADTVPPAATPATVSSDALPTVQINGVVWSQATVGNTVYVTGSFTRARPAGAAAGTNEVVRNNLLAYNITTGALITSFNHSLNAQGRDIVASPDGTRIYVVGDFTSVDGVARNRIAAFSTATGALVTSFAPSLNASATSVTANNSTVYVGGAFSVASGQSRTRLAAFAASNGAITTWRPVADARITAMVLTPDNTRVIVGGQFLNVNSTAFKGLAAVDAATGALSAWPANFPIVLGSSSAAPTDLVADSTQVYGTSYQFTRGGNFEGRFALNPSTGAVNWMNSCHGDSYAVWPIGQVLYSAGHAHDCSDVDSFNQDVENVFDSTHKFAMAETTYPTGVARHTIFSGGNGLPGPRYTDFYGQPRGTVLDWFPTFTPGAYTGQSQATWSVTGNAAYVSFGGEFPSVNGRAQQGLVRFAVRASATNTDGPQADAALTPTVVPQTSGTLRVGWRTTWDRDNETLTYRVYRDGGSTPVYTTTVASQWWNRVSAGFVDTGLAPGSRHTYVVRATDPLGNVRVSGTSASAVVGTGTLSPYANLVRADGAQHFWPLSETSGTTARDYAGYDDLILSATGVTGGTPGPAATGGTAMTFAGPTGGIGGASTGGTGGATGQGVRMDTFSVEAWVRTTSATGGLIAGYGLYQQAQSPNQDRVLYLDAAGHPFLGAHHGVNDTISGADPINDGAWHHVVGTLSPGSGGVLYVDGVRVASSATMRSTSKAAGYWRVGGDRMTGWASSPSPAFLAGSLADVAVYPTALTATQVAAHAHVTPPANQAPTAAMTYTTDDLAVSVSGSGSTDPDGTIAAYRWNFGDGATATGVTATHTYAAAGTYPVTLTVTDNGGRTSSTSHQVSVTAQPSPVTAIATDTFNRAVGNGWGSADLGGAWNISGTASNYAITPGLATMRLPTPGDSARNVNLTGVSATDVDVTTTVGLDKLANGGGATVYLVARRSSATLQYRLRVRITSAGAVQVALTKLDGSATEALIGSQVTVSGLTYTAGSDLKLRLRVAGSSPTRLSAKVWAGSAEPSAWTVSGTDSSAALTAAGSIAFNSYLASTSTNAPVTIRIKSLSAVPPV